MSDRHFALYDGDGKKLGEWYLDKQPILLESTGGELVITGTVQPPPPFPAGFLPAQDTEGDHGND